jgi:hypothetical protein
MTGSDWYEIRARAFFLMRGMEVPDRGNEDPQDRASRTAAWVGWNAINSEMLNAIREAIEDEYHPCGNYND